MFNLLMPPILRWRHLFIFTSLQFSTLAVVISHSGGFGDLSNLQSHLPLLAKVIVHYPLVDLYSSCPVHTSIHSSINIHSLIPCLCSIRHFTYSNITISNSTTLYFNSLTYTLTICIKSNHSWHNILIVILYYPTYEFLLDNQAL